MLSTVSNRSHPFSQISYFTMNSFVAPLSGNCALTSPLHSNISALMLSLILYQLVGKFTWNYLTQSILDNTYLLIGIPFTSLKNLKNQAYPLTNPPAFNLPLKFPWIVFNALVSPLRIILTAGDYSLINFHFIPWDVRIITLAHLAYLMF